MHFKIKLKKMINKNLLIEVLSVPTYFGREELLRSYIINFAIENNIQYHVDEYGNLYLQKGKVRKGGHFPCLVAHIDTVHEDQVSLINKNQKLTIIEKKSVFNGEPKTVLMAKHPNGNITGIGGDDKAGVFICLEILKHMDNLKVAFFVEEEFGCLGSKNSDSNFLKDVGYFIQFDAPGDKWFSFSCNGIQLFNKSIYEEIKTILIENKITKVTNDPYTDVFRLKLTYDVICMNFFAGYHYMHSPSEIVVVEDVEKSVKLGISILKKLRLRKFKMIRGVNPKKLFSLINKELNYEPF